MKIRVIANVKFYKSKLNVCDGIFVYTEANRQLFNLVTGERFNSNQLDHASLIEICEPFTIYPQCTL